MKKVFWIVLTVMIMFVISSCGVRQTNFNAEDEEIPNINEEDIEWYYGQWIATTTPKFVLDVNENEVLITHAMNGEGEVETTSTEAIYKGVEDKVNILLDDSAIKELLPHLFEDGEFTSAKGVLMKDDEFEENTGRESILLAINVYYPDGTAYEEPISFNFTRYEDDSDEEEEKEELERWNSRREKIQDSEESDIEEDEGLKSQDSYEEETEDVADPEIISYKDLDTTDPVQNEAKRVGCYIIDNGLTVDFIPATSATIQKLQLYPSGENEDFYGELEDSVIEASLSTEDKPVNVLEEEGGKESGKVVLTARDGKMVFSK
ncbi:hypothetical protein [Tetragenococcus muriaticus]|uniref:hypothetical protein n=1 Tax=Tetragenococcus muriaticus TaxID=64642 RepID=UPI0004038F1F|nr:hypothetical protein [Tetragenococcus muriaticus]GMA47660.1 hypothetical protein GCM10025854_19100 [Tetragenococcus muriaticus]